MGHWQRAKLKKEIRESFLSESSVLEFGSSMKITCAKSMRSTFVVMLERYAAMTQAKRALSQHKKRSGLKTKSAQK